MSLAGTLKPKPRLPHTKQDKVTHQNPADVGPNNLAVGTTSSNLLWCGLTLLGCHAYRDELNSRNTCVPGTCVPGGVPFFRLGDRSLMPAGLTAGLPGW